MGHWIFLKFYVKLEGLNCQKLTKPNFSVKFSFREKNSSKIGFFGFCQKFNPLMRLFDYPKIVHGCVLYYSAKNSCLEKMWFFTYGLKCSQPIRLQYSLMINISGRNQVIS